MAQIVELLGEIPKSLALSGRYSQELFNKKGESSFSFIQRVLPSVFF